MPPYDVIVASSNGKRASAFGFLVVGVLLGALIGFAGVRLYLASTHYNWGGRPYMLRVATGTIVGAFLGLAAGCVLDAVVRNDRRRDWLYTLCFLLVIGSFICFVLLCPAIQQARE